MSQESWGSGEWGLQGKTFKTGTSVCKGLEAFRTVAQLSGPGLGNKTGHQGHTGPWGLS